MNIWEHVEKAERLAFYLLTVVDKESMTAEYTNSMIRVIDTLRAYLSVHTDHDAQAEMDEWDSFFETLRRIANGNR